MKPLLPLAFLTLTMMLSSQVQAHNVGPTYTRTYYSPAASYCTEARFQSYIALASSMRNYVTPEEYAGLYIPLKVKASKAMVTLRNYGALSSTTHNALYEIVRFVANNQARFDNLWEIEVFFPVAQDLMDMTQSLSRDLQ